jgi:NAD(P)-dependent dehydrogenase (short-subunit alcohol dehydrogenase family)
VITGGSSGIGAAVARELGRRGWSCVLLARGEERLRATAAQVGAEYEVCDVGDRGDVERVASAVTARHPRIHLLVNNAGVAAGADFLTADAEATERVVRINYLGSVWAFRAFLPALETAAPSDVINVVSVAGTTAFPPSGPYSAAKHAQLAFSRATAAQLARRKIRVHAVLPGFVETPGFPQRGRLPPLLAWTVIEPDRVARTIVGLIGSRRREVFVPWWYRPVGMLEGVFPSLVASALALGDYRPAA